MSVAKAVVVSLLYSMVVCLSFNNECQEWLVTASWIVCGILSAILTWTSLRSEEILENKIKELERKVNENKEKSCEIK